jgi:hypothetical protein
MSGRRKARTPTTEYEQSVLAANIRRFFEAPERSTARSDVVREVRNLLNQEHRQWTSRLIRLWFSNNRRHYLPDPTPIPPPPQAQIFIPQPPQYGYVPVNPCGPPFPGLWPPPLEMPPLFRPPPPPPEKTTNEQKETEAPQEKPEMDLYSLPPLRPHPK